MDGAAKFLAPNTVSFERHVPRSAEQVWPLIGTAEGLGSWFIEGCRFDPALGAKFYFMDGWEGQISVYDEGRTISFFPEKGGETTFQTVPVSDGACLFRLTDRTAPGFVPPEDIPMDDVVPRAVGLYQPGGPGTPWVGILAGWHGFADRLVAAAMGQAMPESDRFELTAQYMFYEQLLRDKFS